MTEQTYNQLSKEIKSLLIQFDVTKPQDVFRFLNSFQSAQLAGIEQANNDEHRVALERTLMYYPDPLKQLKNNKRTNDVLFKAVNYFVLQVSSTKYTDSYNWGKEFLTELTKHKDIILSNEDWYLRVIPESAWLITYFKEQL